MNASTDYQRLPYNRARSYAGEPGIGAMLAIAATASGEIRIGPGPPINSVSAHTHASTRSGDGPLSAGWGDESVLNPFEVLDPHALEREELSVRARGTIEIALPLRSAGLGRQSAHLTPIDSVPSLTPVHACSRFFNAKLSPGASVMTKTNPAKADVCSAQLGGDLRSPCRASDIRSPTAVGKLREQMSGCRRCTL
jgi:hypothetical protein